MVCARDTRPDGAAVSKELSGPIALVPGGLRRNLLFRKMGAPVYRAYTRTVVFLPGPPILVNSVPKSGTHLLTSFLDRFPKVMYSGEHRNQFKSEGRTSSAEMDWKQVRRWLQSQRKGQYCTTHFIAAEPLFAALEEFQFASLFVVRDPRDIVVSHAHYVVGLKRHFLHEYYTRMLPEDRLMASIVGIPGSAGRPLLLSSIGSRLASFAGWLHHPGTLVLRFEDLVGAAGGGDALSQRRAIDDIARHISRPLDDAQRRRVVAGVHAKDSATLRRGVIGDWKNHFTDEHRAAFAEVAGPQLVEWGYETDPVG